MKEEERDWGYDGGAERERNISEGEKERERMGVKEKAGKKKQGERA